MYTGMWVLMRDGGPELVGRDKMQPRSGPRNFGYFGQGGAFSFWWDDDNIEWSFTIFTISTLAVAINPFTYFRVIALFWTRVSLHSWTTVPFRLINNSAARRSSSVELKVWLSIELIFYSLITQRRKRLYYTGLPFGSGSIGSGMSIWLSRCSQGLGYRVYPV